VTGDQVRRGTVTRPREVGQRRHDEEKRLGVLRLHQSLTRIFDALLDDRVAEDAIGRGDLVRKERKDVRAHALLL
jgi:hypothetical protein